MSLTKIRLTVELSLHDLDAMHSIISSGVKVIGESEDTKDAFQSALDSGAYGMCLMLVQCGAANVNAKDDEGMSYLHLSALSGDTDLCSALIDTGMDVNVQNSFRDTPLFLAAKEGHLEVVRLLLENGAEDLSNIGRSTALMQAAREGHEEIVRMLIEAGSDVNQKSNNGYTALIWAARYGHEKVVRILIEAGSDVNQKNNGETALILAAYEGHEKVVRILIEAGSDVNQKDNSGNTALILAARAGHEEIVRILIEAGSDVNQKNKYDLNAIMRAARNRHPQTSRILLENGANFTAKDSDGRTALDRVKEVSNDEETIELIEYAIRLHRSTLFIQSIEYLRNHRQEYEEEEVREYIPDHVMNGFFRNTIWKKG